MGNVSNSGCSVTWVKVEWWETELLVNLWRMCSMAEKWPFVVHATEKFITRIEPDLSWVIQSYHWAPPLSSEKKQKKAYAEELQKTLQNYDVPVSNAFTQALEC